MLPKSGYGSHLSHLRQTEFNEILRVLDPTFELVKPPAFECLSVEVLHATFEVKAKIGILSFEGRLQVTRQDLADAQSQLAEARQQLATPPM
jgi:hypothetical protein